MQKPTLKCLIENEMSSVDFYVVIHKSRLIKLGQAMPGALVYSA